ncbi:MAG: NAD(P)/FAD-dependent oxidoreductase [Chloroflexi bacterium]|nr:NAD(P)/FAD-dependent oxidoreductase [Chloroflexota bacterium]MBU1748008.1 NAD(P)/FAD-dependent oxidoreductase [Chloroflexota bacterium]
MNIGIVGGGIAGLTAAYRLGHAQRPGEAGHTVTVYEAGPEIGGQARTFPIAGTRLEIFYHHLFAGDRDILDLVADLGLTDQMDWIESRQGFFHGGTIYDFGTPVSLLKFKPLNVFDRFRAGLMLLFLMKYRNWQALEPVTAVDWVRRWGGPGAYNVIFGPLLRGKFGSSADQVTMTWLWGKIHLRGASRSEGMQKESLGYMRGSFQVLLDALGAAIQAQGGTIHVSTPVERIVVQDGRATGIQHGARLTQHDAVIATVPSAAFLRMTPDLPDAYADNLRWMRYQRALCLVLQLPRPLSHIYWMNISAPDIPFVGVIEQTNYIPPETYAGKHIVYVTNYVAPDSDLYRMNKEELFAHYLPHLRKINPQFAADWVEASWLFRDEAGQPIVTCDYRAHIPDHVTPIAGLYLANTTQIYPEDRGMNYSVRLGNTIADIVKRDE